MLTVNIDGKNVIEASIGELEEGWNTSLEELLDN